MLWSGDTKLNWKSHRRPHDCSFVQHRKQFYPENLFVVRSLYPGLVGELHVAGYLSRLWLQLLRLPSCRAALQPAGRAATAQASAPTPVPLLLHTTPVSAYTEPSSFSCCFNNFNEVVCVDFTLLCIVVVKRIITFRLLVTNRSKSKSFTLPMHLMCRNQKCRS